MGQRGRSTEGKLEENPLSGDCYLYNFSMSARSAKRHIDDVQRQLNQARESLHILEEQVALWRDNLDEARIRALVSETPLQTKEYEELARHVQVAEAEMGRRLLEVSELVAKRDELLRDWNPQ